MAQEQVYTKDHQNGARLAALLINEGTKTVRDIFETQIHQMYMSLPNALTTKKQSIEDSRKNPQRITNPQYRKLYQRTGQPAQSSSEFDLTLLTTLFDILGCLPPPSRGNWRERPDHIDRSKAADIVRLRNFRNEIYAHVNTTGVSKKEFEKKWKEVSAVLCRLGTHKEDCNKWKNAKLDPAEAVNWKSKIMTLMEQDVADVQAIASNLEQVLTIKHVTLSKELKDRFDEVMECVRGDKEYDEFLGSTVFEIMESVERSLGIQDAMFKLLHLDIHRRNEEHENMFRKLSEIESKQTEQGDTMVSILENTKAILNKSASPIATVDLNSKLKEIKDLIGHQNDALKVLILSDLHPNRTYEKLGEALGYVPWDIVLDLDHHALVSGRGIYDIARGNLSKHKTPHIETYFSCESLTDELRESVAKGQKSLWIQVNGCATKKCNKPAKFAMAKVPISSLLTSIFKKIPTQKSVYCVTLLLNNTNSVEINILHNVLGDASDCAEDIAQTGIDFVTIACSQSNLDESFLSGFSSSTKGAVATDNQITQMILSLFCREFTDKYSYPGDKGHCTISCEQIANLKPVMELYHHKFGEIDFTGMTESEISATVAEIRERYQRGSIITPEALYLEDTGRDLIYVKRKEMQKMQEALVEDLERQSKYIETFKNQGGMYMNMYLVYHDACGGATTCVRHLLYKFKSQYPCIELKQPNEDTSDALRQISQNSNLPLLLIAEGGSFTQSEIWSLRKRLDNLQIHGVILHTRLVRHNYLSEATDEDKSQRKFYIPAEINDKEDLAAFKDLYKRSQKVKKIFLFGLLTFLQKFIKWQEHVETCIRQLTPVQRSIMRIVCFIRKYAGKRTKFSDTTGVKTKLLLKYCKVIANSNESVGNIDEDEDIMSMLGYGSDLLLNIKNDDDDIIKPAALFLVDPILYQLDPSQGDRLRNFASDLKCLVEADGMGKEDSSLLVHCMFIKRDKESEIYWSEFISELEDICKRDYVNECLQEFISLLAQSKTGPHLKTLHARYLVFSMRRPKEAIAQIKSALGLSDSESVKKTKTTENVLLSAYGGIYHTKVKLYFKDALKAKGKDVALIGARIDIQEAIDAFELAQTSTDNRIATRKRLHTPVPFWKEAFARHLLLSLYFEYHCEKNLLAFRKFMETTEDKLLKECEAKGMEALGKLEVLLKRDQVYDTNPDLTEKKVTEAKFNFLRLHVDRQVGRKLSESQELIKDAVRSIKEDAAMDIGGMLRLDCTSQQKRHWDDMKDPELELMIMKIDQRIHLPNALSCNYQDIVLAMIHLCQRGFDSTTDKSLAFTLTYATQCCELWVKREPRDHEAHFMLGILKTIDGLEHKSAKSVSEGQSYLETCRKIGDERKSTKSYKRAKFAIAKGNGLKKILPSHKFVPSWQLEVFTGRIAKFDNKFCNVFVHYPGSFETSIKAAVPNWKKVLTPDITNAIESEPLVNCNIYFAHDKIIAFNVNLQPSAIDT